MENQKSSFMANVSDDLLFEILLRLPHGRSAIQCSLVCKRWASLIFSDYFKARFDHRHHQSRYLDSSYALPFGLLLHPRRRTTGMFLASYELSSSNIPAGLTHHFPDSKSYLDFLPQPFSGELIEAITSGDDLLLIETPHEPNYCVCNPLTKQWNILPNPPPNSYPLFHGLWRGYTNQNAPEKGLGSYKVVTLNLLDDFLGDGYAFDSVIFCSESGEWRQRRLRAPKVFEVSREQRPYVDDGVTSNGVVYFRLRVNENELAGFLAVDPIAESDDCRFVELPEGFRGGQCSRNGRVCLGVVRDRLRISQLMNKGHASTRRIRVWELRGVASSEWVLVHNLRVRKDLQRGIYVAAFHPNNGDVIFVIAKDDILKIKIGAGEGEYEKVGEIPYIERGKFDTIDYFFYIHSIVHTSWSGLPL